MKIIDLLNKIANGERPNFRFKGNDYIYDEHDGNYRPSFLGMWKIYAILNYEVEILEEEKKIPEKLPYYSIKKIQKAKNKDEWREERITLLEKRVNDLHIKMNDLLDYLKSKGE